MMTDEERNDAIDFFKEIAGKERGVTKYSCLAIEALEQKPETVTEFADRCRECGARYGKLLKQELQKMREATQEERDGIERYIDSIAEPCEDCVSRQAVHRQINKWVLTGESDNDLMSLHNRVDTLPPAIPQQKIGYWIDDKCSVCRKGIEDLISSSEWYRNEQPNFCPFCGIKLIEPQEKRCKDCNHYGKFSLDCARCDDDCSMYEPRESEDKNA